MPSGCQAGNFIKERPRTGVSEAAIHRSSTKQVFLNNSQNSQESTCVGVPFKIKFRTRRSQMLFKIIALKKFANFTRKHMCWRAFFNKVAGSQNCNFTKKRFQQKFFPVNFVNHSRTPILQRIYERLVLKHQRVILRTHPSFTEHLQWLILTFLGFQPATLLKKRLQRRCFSLNFAKFLRTSFDRTLSDDCFLCVTVNFEKLFR